MSKCIGRYITLTSQLLAALFLLGVTAISVPKANAAIVLNHRIAQPLAPIGYYYPGRFYDGPRWYPAWRYRYNPYRPYWRYRPWYR